MLSRDLFRTSRYTENLDYLVVLAQYLGYSPQWWARSPSSIADELSLDRSKVTAIFEGFPGVFRKSATAGNDSGEHFYALQLRYAHRPGGGESEPADIQDIPPLDPIKLNSLIDFLLKAAEREQTIRTNARGNLVAVGAAIIAAAAAVLAGVLNR